MAKLTLFLDTNVVIDYLLGRQPFCASAKKLMVLGKLGEFDLWVSPSQVTDIIYVLSEGGKSSMMPHVLRSLRGLRTFVGVCEIGPTQIDEVLQTPFGDPEDALVHEAALSVGADVIVTRDTSGFGRSLLKVMDCDGLFEWIDSEFGVVYDDVGM